MKTNKSSEKCTVRYDSLLKILHKNGFCVNRLILIRINNDKIEYVKRSDILKFLVDNAMKKNLNSLADELIQNEEKHLNKLIQLLNEIDNETEIFREEKLRNLSKVVGQSFLDWVYERHITPRYVEDIFQDKNLLFRLFSDYTLFSLDLKTFPALFQEKLMRYRNSFISEGGSL